MAATALKVSYSEMARAGGGFIAKVTIVNDAAQPISGWKLILALPNDHFAALANAVGVANNGVLHLSPAPTVPSIAPGRALAVLISASGPVTTPVTCMFNDVTCKSQT
jgi:Cellulose binding domain